MRRVWLKYYDHVDAGLPPEDAFEPFIRITAWDDTNNPYQLEFIADQDIKVNLQIIQEKLNKFMGNHE